MIKKALIGAATALLLTGCISTELPYTPKKSGAGGEEIGVNAERSTGSNLTRASNRDGVRTGLDRDDMAKIQRSGGSSDPKAGGR